jgi:HD-GYP domain-containing protein (c-di-GMP phosphodiesterase class II)
MMIKQNKNILGQADEIRQKVALLSGKEFMPEIADAFLRISKKECFWLNIVSGSLIDVILRKYSQDKFLKAHNFSELIRLFGKIIDYRNHFTATHSNGVAAVARAIAKVAGFSDVDLKRIEIAGYIHDLGKLAVPAEILEKKDKLSKEEFEIIRTHTYYTDMILSNIKEFDVIRIWGAQHHERLNGEGYPFHYDKQQLSAGSRIMAVADVFVALSEDRPYRKALPREEIMPILEEMVANQALDADIVGLLKDKYAYIDNHRKKAQIFAEAEYKSLA